MDFKFILKTFFFAFILFSIAVALGMKYNWVRFLQPDSQPPTSQQSGNLRDADGQLTPTLEEKHTTTVGNYELVDENNSEIGSDQQIRNDCIRASRQAGVTDENIFAVVDQCVEMSTKERNPGGTASNGESTEKPLEDGIELTRKACKIVADEEQGITEEERKQIVEQCIKANMGE